jgi:hypothetical protein
MVFVTGVCSKKYWSVFVRGMALGVRLECPAPGCAGVLLRGHGWHLRYLAGLLVWLRRVGCPSCGVTHVILPEDVCAWLDLTLVTLEQVVTAGSGPTAGARAAGLAGAEGVRRVRRWRRKLAGGLVRQVVALLPAGSGSWWERAVAVVGSAPGVLVRLRSWLWSAYRLLLTGLAGLLGGGRPWWRVRGSSPELGNCPSG